MTATYEQQQPALVSLIRPRIKRSSLDCEDGGGHLARALSQAASSHCSAYTPSTCYRYSQYTLYDSQRFARYTAGRYLATYPLQRARDLEGSCPESAVMAIYTLPDRRRIDA